MTNERETILAEIKRLHSELGISPGIVKFSAETGIPQTRFIGVYWARWSDALAEAGLATNELQGKFDSDEVLRGLAQFTQKIGRYPSNRDLRLAKRQGESVANEKVYSTHFGNADGIRRALRDFCQSNSDFMDVLPLIPESQVAPEQTLDSANGRVYLLKSGAFFKIGRTDNLERRFREISVTLPQATELVHSISTDDPVGIEAYWHTRFSDRRARGEWFKLTRDDVRAFRRRKFQ